MGSYKELLNKAAGTGAGLKELEPEDAAALKKCLLDIYIRVAEICQEHHLTIMLGGGSCLGAVRHQGFIPWDDDLDVMMPRPDYEQLVSLCEQGELGDRYEFRHPQGDKPSLSPFLKIYFRDSVMMGLSSDTNTYLRKCYIDVFPIDGMPSNPIIRKMKGWVANSLRLIANMVLESGSWSESTKAFYQSSKKLYRVMQLRRVLGKIFSVFSHQRWVSWYDSWVRSSDMSNLIGPPMGRKLYNGEVFPAKVFLPAVPGVFEGIKIWLPADYHAYLSNLYHDYMQIPPKDKRERHFFFKIQIPKEFYQ